MRLIPKRISSHFEAPSPKLKKHSRTTYHEVSSDDEMSDDYDEAITPRSSGSAASSDNEISIDYTDSTGNFVKTMRAIKKELRRTAMMDRMEIQTIIEQNEKIDVEMIISGNLSSIQERSIKALKDRAIYMASRIKKQLPSIFNSITLRNPSYCDLPSSEISSSSLTKTIADRLYTYFYLTYALDSSHPLRISHISRLSDQLSRQGDTDLSKRRGGVEAYYAVRYTLDTFFRHSILPSQKTIMVERARVVIEGCMDSEEKLSKSERECMYAFHKLMSGMRWDNLDVQLCGVGE